MRVLQINSHYNQGGAARIAAYIHRQLMADGEESYVAYGRGASPAEENTYRFNLTPEVYASALVSRAAGIHGWSNVAATGRLLQYMEKVRPQLIHLHALHGYYLNLPMLFSYINTHNLPCVWTFHDAFAFTGNCGYYFSCEKWKDGCGGCPNIHTYPNSQWLDFTAWMWKRKKELFTSGDNKVIVTPSKWLTGEVEKSFFGKYRCMTIRNGIDAVNIFYPRDRRLCRRKHGYTAEEKLVLGIAVGFDDVRKGAKYMIGLARELKGKARIILIGWNEKKNKLPEDITNVVTLPNTSSTDILAEYYSMADVFVLPSLAENYATVTLESMACGTPVVGFDAGGIPEQLEGNRGIAVETGSQEGLNRAVCKVLWKENELLHGEKLAELIKEENSMQKMTEEYKKVYRGLLEKKEGT